VVDRAEIASAQNAVSGISAILAELNHAVRTPLGVAMNVCSDATRGMLLTPQDHQDAFEALTRLRGKFDELRPLLSRDRGTIGFFSETELLLEDEGFQISGEAQPIVVNPTLLRCSIRYIAGELIKRALPQECALSSDRSGTLLLFPGFMPEKLSQILLDTWIRAAGGLAGFSSEQTEIRFSNFTA